MNWLIKSGITALELMFAAGAIGTVVVLVLSAIEDVHTLTDHGESED